MELLAFLILYFIDQFIFFLKNLNTLSIKLQLTQFIYSFYPHFKNHQNHLYKPNCVNTLYICLFQIYYEIYF